MKRLSLPVSAPVAREPPISLYKETRPLKAVVSPCVYFLMFLLPVEAKVAVPH